MGKLKATYNGIELPISITKVDRNIMPPMSHTTQSVGNGDGVFLLDSNFENRVIEVEYVINNYTARNLSDFRDKMALLVSSKELQRLIFSDEPNRYYDAIITGEPTLDEEYLESSGKLSFLVPDGVSHSTDIAQITAAMNNGILTAHINNESTAAVYPVYRIKHTAENGYLGIVHQGGVFEMGNREEPDLESYQRSESMTQSFGTFSPYVGPNPQNTKILHNGALDPTNYNGNIIMRLKSPGSGSYWHGGAYKFDLPEDSNGEIGAKNFYCWFMVEFVAGALSQTGLIQILLTDASNKLIAGFGVQKSSTGGSARAQAWVGGNNPREVYTWPFSPTTKKAENPFMTGGTGAEDILKIGSKLRFYFWNKYYEVVVPELADTKVAGVQVFIGNHGNKGLSAKDFITICGVGQFAARKDNVEKWRDVPNRYPDNSEIVVDTESDSITVNGLAANDEKVDGSEFPMLPVGETDIEFYTSSWCKTPPEVTVEYRKRWL